MHHTTVESRRHPHAFGTDVPAAGERRTRWVIALTFATMLLEIVAGFAFGSMALLADGWHMASHAAALGVTAFAYSYTRRHAASERYSFGTGKVGALGGFGSAVVLAVVALLVLVESAQRLVSPVAIRFEEAIAVAALGLGVNLLSAFLLRDHERDHEEDEGSAGHLHHDHNLRAAYLHVLADALTSVFALAALVTGKFLGWMWMDAVMGVVGSLVIARWSWGLIRDTSQVLLDAEADEAALAAVRAKIESVGDNRVADLHVWRIGPRHLAAILTVVTHDPKEPEFYRGLLRDRTDLAHVTVEVMRCRDDDCAGNAGIRVEPST